MQSTARSRHKARSAPSSEPGNKWLDSVAIAGLNLVGRRRELSLGPPIRRTVQQHAEFGPLDGP